MIKKIFTSIALCIYVYINAQHIEFNNEIIDYGKIKMGSSGKCIFKFKNTGDKPLILKVISTSCGCTVPKWSNNPILPNQWGKIKIIYNTDWIGIFRKNIKIFSNDINSPKIIGIKGEVIE